MRIYFVGSHSTGKSTLAETISEKYNLQLIEEISRKILNEWSMSLKEVRSDIHLVRKFQKKIKEERLKIEDEKEDNFVSDRAFDFLAYTAEHTNALNEVLEDERVIDYIESLKDDLVFFVRPQRELIKDDGVRCRTSWAEVNRIDAMIKYILEEYDIDYININSKDMQSRLRTIETAIKLSDIS